MTNTVVYDVGSRMVTDSATDSSWPSVSAIARDDVSQLVDDLAHAVARSLIADHGQVQEQHRWLARLAALTVVRGAADDLAAHAAAQAAAQGAGYPELAKAAGTTRQNARVKWPGLVPPARRNASD